MENQETPQQEPDMYTMLLQDKHCRESVIDSLGEVGADIVARYLSPEAELTDEELDTLIECLDEFYRDCAESVVCLGWDGDGMAHSGYMNLIHYAGVYKIRSSDIEDLGPYFSLDQGFAELFDGDGVSSPSLTTYRIPLKKILKLATGIVQEENDETIDINGTEYRKVKGKLVKVRE